MQGTHLQAAVEGGHVCVQSFEVGRPVNVRSRHLGMMIALGLGLGVGLGVRLGLGVG